MGNKPLDAVFCRRMNVFTALGLMSGTSLDGVDLACCRLTEENGAWQYELLAAETVAYDERWLLRLSHLPRQDAETLWKTHVFYGKFLGDLVKNFTQKHSLHPHFVASHGHTVFHNPAGGYTCQIGCGASLAAACGLPVVADFRSGDVALGGQGAPLVPMADKLLFAEYACCLNLGGIANLSSSHSGLAFDVCPCNLVLNHIALLTGQPYDHRGELATSGTVNETALTSLNELAYYSLPGPKSLGREWVESDFLPLLLSFGMSPADMAATAVEHIASKISGAVANAGDNFNEKMLVTGGGAFNQYLMSRIVLHSPVPVHVPDAGLVNFKEAIAFALLGALRWMQLPNCLPGATGARKATSGGAIYLP